ncbi:unnamed protein product [Periconia digitata]|uniref:Hydroxyneurosporene synthase n=1 Tax=Periconia digitata TaxID=1303443 RepID=A0A9W4UIF4_9PLEO|nr:unnamed protein product [Periconia digitata]
MRYNGPFAYALPLLATAVAARLSIVPSTIPEGPSEVTFTSSEYGLDAPKVSPLNRTTYDWWYFDVVSDGKCNNGSDTGLSAMTIVFHTAGGPEAFPPLAYLYRQNFTSANLVQISTTFANGTTFTALLNATEAYFMPIGNGVSSIFDAGDAGGGAFSGTADLSHYTLNINAPRFGVNGSIVFDSIAPAHYPAGPISAGQDMRMSPHVGWANAMPDARAESKFMVRGEELNVSGVGYHDKNWGDKAFDEDVDYWYWGHGRVGPYSIVWFDYMGINGETAVSSYVAKDGQILASAYSGITVRPFGENSTYPPLTSTGAPSGYHIVADTPDGVLTVDAHSDTMILGFSGDMYNRWVGRLTGGLNNNTDLEGVGLFEQFAFNEG